MSTEQAPKTTVVGVVPMAVIGCAAGIAEVTCNQPLIYMKNCIQTGNPINFNPKYMYRGYGVNVGSVAPITAFQIAASGTIYHTLFARTKADPTSPPTPFELGFSALLAGGLSGTLSGPSESIILQQQTGLGAGATLSAMYQKLASEGSSAGLNLQCAVKQSILLAIWRWAHSLWTWHVKQVSLMLLHVLLVVLLPAFLHLS
jgi:hypothetical protein